MQINSINFISQENQIFNLKVGEVVDIEVLKLIKADTFLVNIKGNILTALFKNPPNLSRLKGLVVAGKPDMEIKILEEQLNFKQSNLFKAKIADLDIFSLKGAILENPQSNLKDLNPDAVKKLIENAGLFFESKLMTKKDISDDNKFLAIKNGNQNIEDNITKLQITSLLNQAVYYIFKSKEFDISESEILFKKLKKGFKVFINAQFSNLGQVIVEITQMEKDILAVIKSDEDITKYISELNLENIQVRWHKKEKKDTDEFDTAKSALKKLGNLQIYA